MSLGGINGSISAVQTAVPIQPVRVISLDEVNDFSELLLPQFKDILKTDPSADAKIGDLFARPYFIVPDALQATLEHLELSARVSVERDLTPPIIELIREASDIQKDNGEENEAYLDKIKQIESILKQAPQSVNKSYTFDVTILHEAACRNMMRLVTLILQFYPDTSKVNCFGETAAFRSRKMGYTAIADVIDRYTQSLPKSGNA